MEFSEQSLKSTRIFFLPNLDSSKKVLSSFVKGGKVLLLSDQNVYPVYGERLKALLLKKARVLPFLLPAGERSKSLTSVQKILSFMIDQRFLREHTLITLGGGMIGDLGGFVASIYMRGIQWINIPTSLLAMVDASIGGKTGINFKAKNMVGNFYHPSGVLLCLETLNSLPQRLFNEGMAEVIKYGCIRDAQFFSFLEANKEKIKKRQKDAVQQIITTSIRIKKEVVEKDEKEKNLRRVLNFGHTLAHAIEASKRFRLLHGEAVSAGMVYAAYVAREKGILQDNAFLPRLTKLLSFFSLPTKSQGNFEELYHLMQRDKKARQEGVVFVLPQRIGKVVIQACTKTVLKKAWQRFSS